MFDTNSTQLRTCLGLGGVGDFYDSKTRITNGAFTLPL